MRVLCGGAGNVGLHPREDAAHVQRHMRHAARGGADEGLLFEVQVRTVPAAGVEPGTAAVVFTLSSKTGRAFVCMADLHAPE